MSPKRQSKISGKADGLKAYFPDKESGSEENAMKPTKPSLDKSEPLRKASYYLPESLIQELEHAWLDLRKSLESKKVNKSNIVSILLQEGLQNWREQGDDNVLAKRLRDIE